MANALHPDDVVAALSAPTRLGVVERTHGDVDTHQPFPARSMSETLDRDPTISKKLFGKFLKDGVPPTGTVMVQWQEGSSTSLIPESSLKLIDRSLMIGDVVKRHARDAMSGVVINTFTKCALQPCGYFSIDDTQRTLRGFLSGNVRTIHTPMNIRRTPDGGTPSLVLDVPASELRYAEAINEDDLIIFKDRIGRVDELNIHVTLRLLDNSVVEIHDQLAYQIGGSGDPLSVGDIVESKKTALRTGKWIYGEYNANTPPFGTVVSRRIIEGEVTWLQRRIGAPDTDDPLVILSVDEMESDDFHVYDRARRPNAAATTSTNVSNSEIEVQLGLRVRFKDLSGACVKYDGSTPHGKLERIARFDTSGYDMNMLEVASFQTEVTVQWQDLSITREASTALIPDSSVDDEHAAWPGEIVHSLESTPIPEQRGMSQPTKVGVVQTVNPVDRMATMRWCPNASMQYFEDPDDNPGHKNLILAVVNRAGHEQQELSLYDLEAPGSLNLRRGDLVLLMNTSGEYKHTVINTDPDWVGEVVDTCLDGSLTVRLGAAKEVRDIQITRELVRVAVRSDGTDHMDGWDGGESAGSSYDEEMGSETYQDDYSEPDQYLEDDEFLATYMDEESGMPLDVDEVENEEWESDESEDVDMVDVGSESPPTSHSITPPETSHQDATPPKAENGASAQPELYMILEGLIPSSHRYKDQESSENATHMKRVQKEHKILRAANVLPNGVYVRTWEARMDLLRVLFVGPTETPYAHVPFVIDFHLSPTFPSTPPKAFFHSWAGKGAIGGVGKVNPNLYEDGTICLSLLGTWDGDKGEGWSPARSTVLQLVVSILGLVLVREPYFNEAGYEPLAGLESSKRPSALYNERTLMRASAFLIQAAEWLASAGIAVGTDIEGVEDVARWLYKDSEGPQLLQRKTKDILDVLERSEGGLTDPDGLNTVSKGLTIPLKRVVARLKEL